MWFWKKELTEEEKINNMIAETEKLLVSAANDKMGPEVAVLKECKVHLTKKLSDLKNERVRKRRESLRQDIESLKNKVYEGEIPERNDTGGQSEGRQEDEEE